MMDSVSCSEQAMFEFDLSIFYEDTASLQCSGAGNGDHIYFLLHLHLLHYDDVMIHIITSIIITISQWPLPWGGAPYNRWEIHLSDCFKQHNSLPCRVYIEMGRFWNKGSLITICQCFWWLSISKLFASPSGTQLFIELTIWNSMSCSECHYYNKSLTMLARETTGVLVGQKPH